MDFAQQERVSRTREPGRGAWWCARVGLGGPGDLWARVPRSGRQVGVCWEESVGRESSRDQPLGGQTAGQGDRRKQVPLRSVLLPLRVSSSASVPTPQSGDAEMRVFPWPGSVFGVWVDSTHFCGQLAPAAQERLRGWWKHGLARPGVGGETGPTAPGLMLGTESFEQALQLHVTDEKTAAREGQALPATPRTTPSPRGLLVGVTCLPWRSGDFNWWLNFILHTFVSGGVNACTFVFHQREASLNWPFVQKCHVLFMNELVK